VVTGADVNCARDNPDPFLPKLNMGSPNFIFFQLKTVMEMMVPVVPVKAQD
jgi:hypothetical protein